MPATATGTPHLPNVFSYNKETETANLQFTSYIINALPSLPASSLCGGVSVCGVCGSDSLGLLLSKLELMRLVVMLVVVVLRMLLIVARCLIVVMLLVVMVVVMRLLLLSRWSSLMLVHLRWWWWLLRLWMWCLMLKHVGS